MLKMSLYLDLDLPTDKETNLHRLKHDLLGRGNDYDLNRLASVLTVELKLKHICSIKRLNSFFSIPAYWVFQK